MAQVEKHCYENAVRANYEWLVKNGFSLSGYNQIKQRAKSAGMDFKNIFSDGKVEINLTKDNEQLLYHTGWRAATEEEIAEFKAIEAEDQKRLAEEKAKAEEDYQACLGKMPVTWYVWTSNGEKVELSEDYTIMDVFEDYGPGQYQMNYIDYCAQLKSYYLTNLSYGSWFSSRNWIHTDDRGYEVKTFMDIAPILENDGLTVTASRYRYYIN